MTALPDDAPGADFGRIREQAVRGYRQATAGGQDDEEMGCL